MILSDFQEGDNYYTAYSRKVRNSDNLSVSTQKWVNEEVIKVVTDITNGSVLYVFLDFEGDIVDLMKGV